MAVLFHCPWANAPLWLKLLREADPGLDIRVWPEVGDPAEIDFALVWDLPFGELKTYPNLKCVSSLGAGADHILKDPELPEGLPVVRLVYPVMIERMSAYILLAILRYQRHLDVYAEQQRRHEWQLHQHLDAADVRVGIMGLGALGRDAGGKLSALGYEVAGWSRTPKEIPGIACYYGADQRDAFLGRSDYLVNLLALTSETRGILADDLFAALPDGAFVINCGRGDHMVQEDLMAALDSGKLAGATLDAHAPEPLPPDHPFWDHPKIHVTPHISSLSKVPAAIPQVIENIRRARDGRPLLHQMNVELGY